MPVQKSFWDYFWIAKYLCQAMGIVPLGGPASLWKSIISGLLAASRQVYCLYLLIQPIDYILFRTHEVDDLFEAVIIILAVIGAQFRSLFAVVHRRKFVRLFTACVKLWDNASPSDYAVISTWAERARLFTTIYFCAAQIVPEIFVVTSTIRQLSSPENSTIKYYPYGFEEDPSPSPQFEIKFILQIICGHLGMAVITAIDVAGILLALILCGQLDLIRNWLLNISSEESATGNEKIEQQVEVGLKRCIRHHQDVMNFCAELEEAVQYINLTQILTGMYIFSIAGARLMKSISYRNFGPLMTAIIGFFFSCWPAESLISASNGVTHAVYELPWYRYSHQEKIAVTIMLMRSQRPAELTGGKFVILSLETFSSILCNGFSFCMVLNSF